MATEVEGVRNELFDMPVLVTRAGSVIHRNRISYPPNNPGVTYGNNANNNQTVQQIVEFDLMDPKRFILTRNLVLTGLFIPSFFRGGSNATTQYPEGCSPQLDASLQALATRIRIGNQQGLIIEEIFQYGLMANMIESMLETPQHKEFSSIDNSSLRWHNALDYMWQPKMEVGDEFRHFSDNNSRLADNVGRLAAGTGVRQDGLATITGTNIVSLQARSVVFPLHHSSFLNKVPVIPLKHFNHALRISIEWNDPRYCFYNNHLGVPPKLLADLTQIGSTFVSALVDNNASIGGSFLLTVPAGWFNCTALDASNAAVVTHNIPTTGEFWVLAWNGRARTVVYVVKSGGANGAAATIVLAGENAHATGAATPYSVTGGPQNVGASVKALQQLYGCYPAGGKYWNGSADSASPANGLFYPASAATALDGQLGMTLTANTIINGSQFATLFNQIWVLPVTADPFSFGGSPLCTSLAFQNYANPPSWGYAWQNLNLLVDAVLPSDPVRAAYMSAFMMPQGISYPYKRILYQNFYSQVPPPSGWQQFQVNVRAKSLTALLCVMTDELFGNPGSDVTGYNCPSLSSFRTCGASQAYLQIGGDRFPLNPIDISTSMIEVNHIPELMTCLNTAIGSNAGVPTFPMAKLHKEGRNYGKYGNYGGLQNGVYTVPWVNDQTQGRVPVTDPITGSTYFPIGTTNTTPSAAQQTVSYVDTSKFILGFNTSKNDGDFMSGVDVSAAGSLIVNINYNSWGLRRFVLHVFAICDAVFTLQEGQSLVRM